MGSSLGDSDGLELGDLEGFELGAWLTVGTKDGRLLGLKLVLGSSLGDPEGLKLGA